MEPSFPQPLGLFGEADHIHFFIEFGVKAISRESDVRKDGLQVFTQFLAPCVIVIVCSEQ